MPVEQNSDEALLLDRREEPGAVASMLRRLSKTNPAQVWPQLADDIGVNEGADVVSDETGNGSSSEIILDDEEVVANAS